MGGCYSSYSDCSRSHEDNAILLMKKHRRSGNIEDLVQAYRTYFDSKNSGFIKALAEVFGIADVTEIPKEFPNFEYEVKFDIQPTGEGKEPEITDFLNAFDFPATRTARFLKDPVNNSAVGINSFLGNDSDERLVIIEKAGGIYLKEKGPVVPLDTGVMYEEVVIKREEKRWKSSMDEVIAKAREVCAEKGVSYKGKIRKEKGDAFILDTDDGRIYSFTVTRAHLTRPNEKEESETQRQLEMEYAGYIPEFSSFRLDSEPQIVRGMVDLAKYVAVLYGRAPIKNGWSMNLAITGERKYDFVKGIKELPEQQRLGLPLQSVFRNAN